MTKSGKRKGQYHSYLALRAQMREEGWQLETVSITDYQSPAPPSAMDEQAALEYERVGTQLRAQLAAVEQAGANRDAASYNSQPAAGAESNSELQELQAKFDSIVQRTAGIEATVSQRALHLRAKIAAGPPSVEEIIQQAYEAKGFSAVRVEPAFNTRGAIRPDYRDVYFRS